MPSGSWLWDLATRVRRVASIHLLTKVYRPGETAPGLDEGPGEERTW
jgi:hypothetical protein